MRTDGRSWDVPTPRASQGSSPDQANVELDIREWEEGQVADGAVKVTDLGMCRLKEHREIQVLTKQM